ncbi:c-type cytochrome [Plesiomonas sp.]|uniref:c-type cytochrome n=1 Tax=Plesiomonas sp. TaxID=2486279 RepID=UPI003F325AD5
MKKFALVMSMMLGVSGMAQAQGDAEAGKKIASAVCVACHNADGNSTITANPKLAGQHNKYLFKQLKEFQLAAQTNAQQGRANPIMQGQVATLSEQDLENLAAWFSQQTSAPAYTRKDSVELGKQLYMAGDKQRGIPACVACHGPRGNGTDLSGFPKISGQHADYIIAQLNAFRSGQRQNDPNSMMRQIAASLTDKEISALAGYLGGLH